MKTKAFSIRRMAFIAVMAAVATALMFLKIAIPIAPSFMKMDISELPALITGFYLGPVAGFVVILIKILLHTIIEGTDTAFVGEAANIIMSSAFVVPAALIYKANRTKKGAMISLVAASVIGAVAAIFVNLWITFPLYGKLYGITIDAIVGMMSGAIPAIKNGFTLMLFSIFPFNLIKHIATSILTWLLYKRTGKLLRRINVE